MYMLNMMKKQKVITYKIQMKTQKRQSPNQKACIVNN